MRTDNTRSSFLLGLMVGVGVGLATCVAFDLGRRARGRTLRAERSADAERLAWLDRGSARARARRTKRTQAELNARIERLRSAGL